MSEEKRTENQRSTDTNPNPQPEGEVIQISGTSYGESSDGQRQERVDNG